MIQIFTSPIWGSSRPLFSFASCPVIPLSKPFVIPRSLIIHVREYYIVKYDNGEQALSL